MKKKIALIGGGGFAKEVAEIVEMTDREVYGIFSDEISTSGYTYYGPPEEVLNHRQNIDGVHIAFGGLNSKAIADRLKIIDFLEQHKLPVTTLVSPHARVHSSVKFGDGCFVSHDVMISIDAVLGANTIVNSRAIIGHDVTVGKNCTICPMVFVGGATSIGENCLLGAAALIMQNKRIGDGTIVGMGAKVFRNTKDNSLIVEKGTNRVL